MINLLPTRYRDEVRQEENRKLISILGILFLLFLISAILILFSVKIYIQGQLDSVKVLADLGERTLKIAEIQRMEQEIKSANKNISKLSTFYGKQRDTTGILEKIFKTLPPEIRLTAFSWRKETDDISISGFSPSRDILFSFQKNLKAQSQFIDQTTIDFPSQNWTKSSNIDFYVTFKLANQGTTK